MAEIYVYLSFNQIEMLKDFKEGNCGIDDINLQWTDELYYLLNSLGDIVSTEDFTKNLCLITLAKKKKITHENHRQMVKRTL